jgi:error-prone DNA polymerase
VVMGARLMAVHGFVQKDEPQPDCRGQSGPDCGSEVIHVVAQRLEDHSGLLGRLSDGSLPSAIERQDHAGSWGRPKGRHPRNVEIIPKSRDFH